MFWPSYLPVAFVQFLDSQVPVHSLNVHLLVPVILNVLGRSLLSDSRNCGHSDSGMIFCAFK